VYYVSGKRRMPFGYLKRVAGFNDLDLDMDVGVQVRAGKFETGEIFG